MMLSGWKAALLLSGLMAGANARGWSIGIPGVISVGSDGPAIRVGPKAQGVDVPTPNCGGDICNALEKGKNEINGENERKRAQEDADRASVELADVNKQLQDVNEEIDATKRAIDQDKADFAAFKARVAEEARGLVEKYKVFADDQAALPPLLQQALANVQLVRQEHAVLTKGARVTHDKLHRAFTPEAVDTTRAVALSLEDMALTPNSPVQPLRQAVQSFQTIAVQLDETVSQSSTLLASLGSEANVKKFGTALDELEKSLEAQREAAPALIQSVRQSQNNVENVGRQVSATTTN